jgi:hypothetical protein
MLTTFLQKLLYRIPFLSIKSDHDVDRFAAHLGWSIAICQAGYIWLGPPGLYIAAFLWTVECLIWKFIICGHLALLLKGTDPAVPDLITNLFSRLIAPIIWIIFLSV